MSKPYDMVIIGSGMGGLCSAYILSKEGYKVCVLEKNRQLGGNLQIFSRNKAIFDTGVHYMGGLAEGQNLNQYFKYFGLLEKLNLKQLDIDGFDHVSFKGDNNTYKHAQGYAHFVEVLSQQFPEERQNLIAYIKKIQEVCDSFPLYRIQNKSYDIFTKYLEIDTKAFLQSITKNVKLQNVLGATNLLYAGEANKTPLFVHALVVNSYIESSWRCVGGGGQIAKHLADSIKQMGGAIFNYSEATKFHFSGNEIKEVELIDGRKIAGKNFICNTDLSKALKMVGNEGNLRKAYTNRISNLENTMSVFVLYLTFKKNTMPYFNYNIYHHAEDVWDAINCPDEKDFPKGYAVFPQIAESPNHPDSLIVMCYMRYDEVKKWAHTKHIIPNYEQERGADYEAFKQEKSEKIIHALQHHFPDIKKNILSVHASTPLTYRDYIGTTDGNMYGIAKDYKDPARTFITPRTKIPNLLFTGQNITLHGILGVTVSSVVTCSEFVDRGKLIKDIQSAT
ncbi:MAG: NAD(P)/FAD-dependent oxidoreductase [Bacteroidetes bacterium]|nr:NAD(P)/FAD-dependent oxidoreductase [Bacteroidota bacterium]